jgi:O-antigen ligase
VAIFNHPNFLASYMVVIFGLGLGLTLGYRQMQAALPSQLYFGWARLDSRWVYLSTGSCFLGIFCAGSRNALAVAIGQLLVAIWLWRAPRWLSWLVWGGLGALAVLIVGFGVGGRRVTLEVFSQDPRFGLWQIAAQLISEHPWWGWGLGSFKLLYPARLLDPGYPTIAHPHNFWLMLASEAGLPAMLLLTGMVGYITYRAVRLWRRLDRQNLNPNPLSPTAPLRPLLLTLLLAWGGNTAYALFDTTLFDARINLINWTMLAGLQGCLVASSQDPSSGSGVQD